MTARRPLVLVGGVPAELPTADSFTGFGTADSPQFTSLGLGAAAVANTGIYAVAAVNGVYKLLFENTSAGVNAFASMQWKNDAGNIGVIFMNGSGNTLYAGANSLLLNNSSNNPLGFGTNDTVRWTISAAGHLLAFADNSYDIGAASATRPRNIYCSGNQLVTGAGGTGYGTGSGGAVTQLTSKATGVTLNKTNGQITMNGAALAASTSVAFTLTNSTIAATDVVNISIASGATSLAYLIAVEATAAGSCRIVIRNVSAGSLSEALVLNFAIMKAVTS